LFDRIAVGFWSGGLALILGAVLWFLMLKFEGGETPIPFLYIAYFAAGMAALGFLLCQNVIVAVLAALIHVIFELADEKRSFWWMAAVLTCAVVVLWWLWRQ
jgi:hypothetical protein